MPCELLFLEAKILEGLYGDLHKLRLGQSRAVVEDEEGPRLGASRSHKCSHRCHWAEEVASPAHDHLGSPAELVRLRVAKIDSDGMWVFQVVDRHIASG